MAVAGADAVRAGVATTDHDDVLARSRQLAFDLVTGIDLVLLWQKLHREMHTIEVAAGHRQVARLLGPAGQNHGVKVLS